MSHTHFILHTSGFSCVPSENELLVVSAPRNWAGPFIIVPWIPSQNTATNMVGKEDSSSTVRVLFRGRAHPAVVSQQA